MDEKTYLAELGKIPNSRLNQIIMAVNEKTPKQGVLFNSPVEEQYFDNLVSYAKDMEKRTGKYPVYDMREIEYDDPVLDIYSKPVEEW